MRALPSRRSLQPRALSHRADAAALARQVKVLERFEPSGRGKVVEFSAGTLGLSISYTLSYTLDEPESVSWVSIAGGVKSIVGQYRLTPSVDGGTRVQYRLDVDAGFGVPGPESARP